MFLKKEHELNQSQIHERTISLSFLLGIEEFSELKFLYTIFTLQTSFNMSVTIKEENS